FLPERSDSHSGRNRTVRESDRHPAARQNGRDFCERGQFAERISGNAGRLPFLAARCAHCQSPPKHACARSRTREIFRGCGFLFLFCETTGFAERWNAFGFGNRFRPGSGLGLESMIFLGLAAGYFTLFVGGGGVALLIMNRAARVNRVNLVELACLAWLFGVSVVSLLIWFG